MLYSFLQRCSSARLSAGAGLSAGRIFAVVGMIAAFLGFSGLGFSGCIIDEGSDYIQLYAGCARTPECEGRADACFQLEMNADQHVGHMCSSYCSNDSECPGNGACLNLENAPIPSQICYSRCERNDDCANGFECVGEAMGSRSSVCLPTR